MIYLEKGTWAAWAAVFISMLMMIINTWLNCKKMREDLISKSRIEWIQNVRTDFSSYVGEVYRVLDKENNTDEIPYLTRLMGVKSYSVKVLSYFGYGYNFIGREKIQYDDKQEKIQYVNKQEKIMIDKSAEKILKNTLSNKGKNELICEYINALTTEVEFFLNRNLITKSYDYRNKMIVEKKDVDGNDVSDMLQNKALTTIGYEDGTKYDIDTDGTLITNKYSTELNNNIENLSKIISIYLKIEWERAKKGQ